MTKLKAQSNPRAVEGMAMFGINRKNTLGISIPQLRELAREVGRDHVLARDLWETGLHEARILAGFVDDPERVTEKQMESWVKDFDSWDVCDQVCGSLFDKTPFAHGKAVEWTGRGEEFVKRAGFALMATLAVHDKNGENEMFVKFLPIIKRESTDARNFVRKAVNWALRQIGKRNARLNAMAVQTAKQIQKIDSKPARWIASDALRELTDPKTLRRLQR